MRYFYQDRLGTNIGKSSTQKQTPLVAVFVFFSQAMGAWNMRDTHLHTPIPLSSWAVINLGRARDEQVHRFVENLVGAMISSGIFVEPAAQVRRRRKHPRSFSPLLVAT